MPRENTSSGKPQKAMEIGDQGAKRVARVLDNGKPSSPYCGGKSGMQVKIPSVRDVSKVK
jgi:hypothetical protein